MQNIRWSRRAWRVLAVAMTLALCVACDGAGGTNEGGTTDVAGADVVVPAEDVILPREDIAEPQKDVVAPPEDIVAPPEDIVTPPEDVIVPPEDVVVPPEDIVAPPEDVVVPPEDIVVPPEDIVAPPEDIVAPPEDIVEPPEDIVEPPEDIVAPPEDIVAPPEDIVAPPEDIVEPPEDIVEPPEDIVEPPEDIVEPPYCDPMECEAQLAPLPVCQVARCVDDVCVAVAAPDGEWCDDGDPCTWDGTCAAGECVGAGPTCDDGDPCTIDSCDPATGVCTRAPAPGGTPCDDGQACTLDDACNDDGWCQGSWNECDDGDPCTSDGCVWETGQCEHAPMDDGMWCDDGDACTFGESCQGGVCVAEGALCDDGDPCTENRCDPETGACSYPPTMAGLSCDDFDDCTIGDECDGLGGCAGQPKCDDGDACTTDVCDWGTCNNAPVPDGSACDDGDACTMMDACDAGVCVGEAIDCDDSDVCTVDRCEAGACIYDASGADGAVCDDGNVCTDDDRCASGLCVGEAIVCEDENPCTADSCDVAQGCVFDAVAQDGAVCDDGDDCTTEDACSAGVCAGMLQAGAVGCDAGETCADAIAVSEVPFGMSVASGEPANDYMYPCEDPGYDGLAGGDVVFRVDAPEDGLYRVSLHMLEIGWTTILYVTDDCPDVGPACLGYGVAEWLNEESFQDVDVEVSLRRGQSVWATVDEGASGVPGDFELRVELVEARELSCDDGLDNDANGLTDCDDPQCLQVGGCRLPGDDCGDPIVIDSLPFAYEGDTRVMMDDHGVDAPDEGGIACDNSPGGQASADIVFLLEADRDGVYRVTTEDLDDDPEGFNSILYATQVCPTTDSQDCLDYSNGYTNGGDSLWLRLERGESAYVILDGAGDIINDAGLFHLDAWLERAEEHVCDDGQDGDLDGDIDCDDTDCAGQGDCIEPEICDDGLDNDGDYRTDCYDSDCETYAGCYMAADVCWSARRVSSLPYYFSAGYTYDKEDDYVNPCESYWDGDGYNDEVYVYTPSRDGRYRFTIDNPTSYTYPELDGLLYIVEGCPITSTSLCHGSDTMSFSAPGVATPAVVDVDLTAGQTVYAVVDGRVGYGGYGSEYGWYTFSLVQVETVCDDGEDDDFDGDIDCDDEDCRWAPGC